LPIGKRKTKKNKRKFGCRHFSLYNSHPPYCCRQKRIKIRSAIFYIWKDTHFSFWVEKSNKFKFLEFNFLKNFREKNTKFHTKCFFMYFFDAILVIRITVDCKEQKEKVKRRLRRGRETHFKTQGNTKSQEKKLYNLIYSRDCFHLNFLFPHIHKKKLTRRSKFVT
jgi:hypothetical protein